MSAPTIYGYVVRLIIPDGKFLPVQQYYCPDHADPWSDKLHEAKSFEWSEADAIAKRLTSKSAHVFPVTIQTRRDQASPGRFFSEAQDWHEGKPNCGVD